MLATLLAVLAAGTIAWAQRELVTPGRLSQASLPAHHSTIAIDGGQAVDLQIRSQAAGAAVERLRDTSHRTIRIFTNWLGPLVVPSLTVIDLPWRLDAPGAAYPGMAATRTRWIAPERDLTAERSLIAGLARQFWMIAPPGADPWFREGLVIYSATRGIHTALEGRNFAAPRHFGGFVSFPLRGQLLSPSPQGPRPTVAVLDEVVEPAAAPWRFAPSGEGSAARRAAIALTTLERTIGWPAMQQILFEVRARSLTAPLTPELLAAVVTAQRGIPADWFAREVLRDGNTIDYAIDDVRSATSSGRTQTTVSVRRLGNGVFAATDRPRGDGPARSLTVQVSFADGTESRAFIDGRDADTAVVFDSVASPTMVKLDPDGLVLVDANRSNNQRLLESAPPNRTGIRLILGWMLWLQNVMLTYTAIA